MSKFRQIVETVINTSINNMLLEAKTLKLDVPEEWNQPYSHFIVLVNPSASEIYNFWKNSRYHDIRAFQKPDTGDYYWADAYYLTHPDLIDILYRNGYISPEMHEDLISDYDSIEITQDRRVYSDMAKEIPGLEKYFLLYSDKSHKDYDFTSEFEDLAHHGENAFTKNPESIKDIENPEEWMQLHAVISKPEVIKYIKNPTENVKALYNLLTKDEL